MELLRRFYPVLILFLSPVVLLFAFSSANQEPVKLINSPYSYKKTIHNLKSAIAANNFKIVREYKTRNSHTFYFCNFNVAYKAIKLDHKAGIMLPCRIRVLNNDKKVLITTVNVNALQQALHIKIGALCQKFKSAIEQIVSEAVI